MSVIASSLVRLIIPKYTQFGSLYELSSDGLISVDRFNIDTEFSKIFKNPDRLIPKIQDHFIDNYFRKLNHNR